MNPNTDPRAWLGRPLRSYLDGPFNNRFMAGASKRTRDDLRSTMRKWETHVDERPPLGSIEDGHLAQLRDRLDEQEQLSPATINKHLDNVTWLLGSAGPRDNKHPGALEWLPRVPWVQRLHEDEKSIRTVTDEEFEAFHDACDVALHPKIDGVKPGDWWRSLTLTAFTAIVRRGALLNELRWSHVRLKDRWLTIEGKGDKVGRVRTKRLHEAARAAMLKIRVPGEDRVYPWDYCNGLYYRTWARIEKASGTSFGLHDLKRSALSRLAPHVDVATLQKLGDHASIATTLKFYVHVGDERSAEAIDEKLSIPQGIRGSINDETDFRTGTGS
jgi:integrase